MYVQLIESLRCPAEHAESALVATAARQRERRILDGTLGCPVCGAEYLVRDGVADFRAARQESAEVEARPSDDEAGLRLAAQLDLTEGGRRVLLCGSYAALAPAISVAYDAFCLTIGAPAALESHLAAHASVLRVDAKVPLAAASLSGVAIDAPHVARLGVDQIAPLLRANGRLVAPADAPLPVGVRLLARDAREWVAARTRDPAVILPLARARR